MQKPNYYGILPASVRYDKQITAKAGYLFTEITALSNKYGYCNASNTYFAKLYDVNEKSVSRWFSSLKKAGHVKIELLPCKKGVERRVYPIMSRVDNNEGGYGQNCGDPLNKIEGGNSTRVNTTRNNKLFLNLFNDFYKKYPLKKSPKLAERNYLRIIKKAEDPKKLHCDMLNAITRQMKERAEKEKRGDWQPDIKHPAFWLSQGCWMDAVEKLPSEKVPNYVHEDKKRAKDVEKTTADKDKILKWISNNSADFQEMLVRSKVDVCDEFPDLRGNEKSIEALSRSRVYSYILKTHINGK